MAEKTSSSSEKQKSFKGDRNLLYKYKEEDQQ